MLRSWMIRVKGIRSEILFTASMFRMDCHKPLNWGRKLPTYAPKWQDCVFIPLRLKDYIFTFWLMYLGTYMVVSLNAVCDRSLQISFFGQGPGSAVVVCRSQPHLTRQLLARGVSSALCAWAGF